MWDTSFFLSFFSSTPPVVVPCRLMMEKEDEEKNILEKTSKLFLSQTLCYSTYIFLTFFSLNILMYKNNTHNEEK